MMLMYLAVLPPEHNPFIDDHIIYSLVLISLALMGADDWWGFGRQWNRSEIVKKNTWLR